MIYPLTFSNGPVCTAWEEVQAELVSGDPGNSGQRLNNAWRNIKVNILLNTS